MARTRSLDAIEIRVLGALMEKELTTPDYYPLTISATIAACNQKSNRDPVLKLTETQVVEALDRLAADVLAWRATGPRAERWQHRLDRRWELDRPKKAVMTLLMLRGPQTAGELRARSERMHHFADVGEVTATLGRLAEEPDPLVRELPRQPGKRETRWTHLAGDEESRQALEQAASTPAPVVIETAPRASSGAPDAASRPELVEGLLERVDALESEVETLRADFASLLRRLGE